MPTKDHQKDLLKRLVSTTYAARYLKAAFQDGDEPAFLLALKNVVEAHGGISKIATDSDITRQHLHRVLSEEGNPTLTTLRSVLSAVGIAIDFSADERDAA